MDDSIKEVLAGIRQAMQAERNGQQFYAMAAMTTQDETAKVVFRDLAEEEERHFEYLKAHYRSLLETGTLDAKATLRVGPHLEDQSPIFSAELRQRIGQAHFEMSALAIAVQLELNAINHYREQAKRTKIPEAKRLFEELVEWESSHYNAFLHQQQELQEAYWAEAGFEKF